MFWYLGLAHLLGDYPLQSDWIVQHKTNFWVLLLHVSIHFATMMVILYPASSFLWPYLLVLAAIHFGIDALKNWFRIHHPAWITWPYLIDQVAHILSLVLISLWINANAGSLHLALPFDLAIDAVGFLTATYVWLITERVLRISLPNPINVSVAFAWKRLFFRALLFAVLLFGRQVLFTPAASLFLVPPYTTSREGARFFFTDIAVTLIAVILVILAGQTASFIV